VRLEGEVYTFVWETRQGQPGVLWRGRWYPVELKDERALLLERLGGPAGHAKGASRVLAPMPGLVLRVLVREGEPVRRGQPLLVLEAMKMENEIRAPAEGVVQRVHVQERQPVEKNALLVELG
jgi:pyruvate carboxylase subunit B